MPEILKDGARYPPDKQRFIVEMMRKFELCFDFPGSPGMLLVPELLSKNEPDVNWRKPTECLCFEYAYGVLPSGLLPRFIVRMHPALTDKPTYWRSGVVLALEGCKVLVRGDTRVNVVRISVDGPTAARRAALAVVRHTFKEIHATIPKLQVEERVPLPDVPGVAVPYRYLLQLEELSRRNPAADLFFPQGLPQDELRQYSARDLLNGVDESNVRTMEPPAKRPRAVASDARSRPAGSTRSTSAPTRRQPRSILAVATEWESRHGGLSTFNRDLCRALAKAGHRVACAVPAASDAEHTAAKEAGVTLVTPPPSPGFTGDKLESLLLGIKLHADFRPELVLGHDRKTGPHAKALADSYGARRVHIIHTRPEDLEWYKDALGEDDAALQAEQRRELQKKLAECADLVVGVGPNLKKAADTLLYTAQTRPDVIRLDPGFEHLDRPSDLPPEIHCLVLGRAEDFEFKGLDIAAAALSNVARRGKVNDLRLLVRGAPHGTGAALRKTLSKYAKGKLSIEVREYTPGVERLRDDILSASLMLMPSRSEGFGLVGLEAIAAATPVLVSNRSGLATLLREHLDDDQAGHFVVATTDDFKQSVGEWERRIEATLMNREAAFSRTAMLRDELGARLTWANAVQALEDAWEPLFQGSP